MTATITFRIMGIRRDPLVSIPIDAFRDIENAIPAMRFLLAAFGEYGIDDIPCFDHDSMILVVVPKHADAPSFDSVKFDTFARNIAEFVDARSEGRAPLLNHEENGVVIEKIEEICASLKNHGKIVFSINGMPDIELTNRRMWKASGRERYITMLLESTEAVSALECSSCELVMPDTRARSFQPGDSIMLERTGDTTPIHREIGSLVDVIDNAGPTTADMFGAGEDDD